MINILLVDDQAVIRAGFRVIFESEDDLRVIGEASTGTGALSEAKRLRPDVVCLDIRMPGGDGLSATRAILNELDPPPGIVIITTFDLDEYVFGALEAGASAFLLKDAEPEELITAVRRVAAGDGLVDHAVTRRVIAEFARRTPPPATDGAVELLTPREADIVRVLAEGRSNVEIAQELYIEPSTVKSHLTRAMAKIGTRDRLQTVVWAYRHGLVRSSP